MKGGADDEREKGEKEEIHGADYGEDGDEGK